MSVPSFLLDQRTKLLVLGVGNILWADEGFGVRCVDEFHRAFRPLEGTRVMDGGTLGMYLLEPISSTDDLFIFDCADLHDEPGTIRLLEGEDVGIWSNTKISAHQQGVNDVLAMAEIQGKLPKRIAVVAVQPKELEDYGGSLTDATKDRVAPAVEAAAAKLAEWGYVFERRAPGEKVEPLGDSSLQQSSYEEGRPGEDVAFRGADIRFVTPSILKED